MVRGKMGDITEMLARRNRRPKVLSAVAMLALSLTLPMSALAAQDAPGGFSLPPGPQPQPQPPSDVQGPVDSESDPPRRTDQPAPSAPAPALPDIAPVPVPQTRQSETAPDRARTAPPREQRQNAPSDTPRTSAEPEGEQQEAGDDESSDPANGSSDAPAAALPVPVTPGPPAASPLPETSPDEEPSDGSVWWWLAAGLIALASLIAMGLRQRSAARAKPESAPEPFVTADTVPTPPLRSPPPAAQPKPQPAPPPASFARASVHNALPPKPQSTFGPVPAPAAAPAPASAPPLATRPQIAESAADQPPRLLLDFTTLGVDVTLVNAIARYHLAVTNMAAIPVSEVALHGTVVQARRGMPPTIDPLRGDTLLPLLQKLADIAPDGTQRCEGQIRLPLEQIEPIAMQGRLLFVPVVHIWIGYTGPDGTRYAVTQSFVLGEESSPPGPRVGPLRLDLGPRRFTEVGQRPLQPV